MLGGIASLLGDVVKIAAAPVSIAADVARVASKPLADAAQDAAKEVLKALKQEGGCDDR